MHNGPTAATDPSGLDELLDRIASAMKNGGRIGVKKDPLTDAASRTAPRKEEEPAWEGLSDGQRDRRLLRLMVSGYAGARCAEHHAKLCPEENEGSAREIFEDVIREPVGFVKGFFGAALGFLKTVLPRIEIKGGGGAAGLMGPIMPNISVQWDLPKSIAASAKFIVSPREWRPAWESFTTEFRERPGETLGSAAFSLALGKGIGKVVGPVRIPSTTIKVPVLAPAVVVGGTLAVGRAVTFATVVVPSVSIPIAIPVVMVVRVPPEGAPLRRDGTPLRADGAPAPPDSPPVTPDGAPVPPPTSRRAPAPDNYRGRYMAERHAQERPRLPDDWDLHHRIPQEYRNHPELRDFDFHHPSNLQGVRGSRADVNVHQRITNEWAEFRRQNPNATRTEIENFANQIDQRYANEWFQ